MKAALINAIAAMSETDAVALWGAVSQWADNMRGHFDEAETVTEEETRQLRAAQALEEAGAMAMAALDECRHTSGYCEVCVPDEAVRS